MSARTSRSSAREPEPKKERAPSPLSPTKIARVAEKDKLSVQNNRLAHYIDWVRSLQGDNATLQNKISTIEETRTTEVTTLRSAYDRELALTRKALDETSRDKAKFEMESEKAKIESKEAKQRCKEKEDEAARLARAVKTLEAQAAEQRARAESATDELVTLKPELENLKNKFDDTRQKLEDETLKRIDLQNQLQTIDEHNLFQRQVLEQQLNETRFRKQMEIEEVDSKAQQNYEAKLADALKELRDTYEKAMSENRSEFGAVYEKKNNDLASKLAAERNTAVTAVTEMKEMKTRLDGMSSRVDELEMTNAALQRRVNELTGQLDDLGRRNRADMARKDHEIDYLNEQITNQTKEYEELLEIKIGLDMEILAYQKLLDGEEARLGASPADMRLAGRGLKRKRLDLEESYVGTTINSSATQQGHYLIEPLAEAKNCIKVTNTSGEEQNLGGLVLRCQSDGLESSYKFTRSHKIPAGGTIAVWNSDSGVEHSVGEGQLVMKTGAWKMGDEVLVELFNKAGDQLASRVNQYEREARQLSQSSAGEAFTVKRAEEEKCIIM